MARRPGPGLPGSRMSEDHGILLAGAWRLVGEIDMRKDIMVVIAEYQAVRHCGKLVAALAEFLATEDVNRPRRCLGKVMAPLHLAVILEDLDLLDLFRRSEVVDLMVESGVGRVLELAVERSSLEVVAALLQFPQLDEEGARLPYALDLAVRKGREDLITLLTKDCSKLQAYHAMVAATRHNDIKVFRRSLAVLAAEVGDTASYWAPDPTVTCERCKGRDSSLVHLAICGGRPLMLRALVAAGCDVDKHMANGSTPLAAILVSDNPHDKKLKQFCPKQELLAELLVSEGVDLEAPVELSGALVAPVEAAGACCHQLRKQVEKATKKQRLRRKVEMRREKQGEGGEGKVEEREGGEKAACSACGAAGELAVCGGCRAARYCGEGCQAAHWGPMGGLWPGGTVVPLHGRI